MSNGLRREREPRHGSGICDELAALHALRAHVLALARKMFGRLDRELTFAGLVNAEGTILNLVELISPAWTTTPEEAQAVRAYDIVTAATVDQAVGIALCTLRPGGGVAPTTADWKLNRSIADASRFAGVELLEHVIVDPSEYYSFQECGTL
jgi:DNA repair protein RadC